MNINQKNLSEQQLKALLSKYDASSIAGAFNHASAERRTQIFSLLPAEKAEGVFRFLGPVNQAQLIQDMERKKAVHILEKMEPDDRARLFEEMPTETAHRFLQKLSSKERRATSLLLKYPPETAGRIMSPFFVALKPELTVEEALKVIKDSGQDAETIHVLPVVDDDMLLQGVVGLDNLVLANRNQYIKNLMYQDIKSFSVYDDQEKIARFIQSIDWLAVPIIDEDKRLAGIVTMDDAMDIMQAEETEDIFRGSASGPLGKPYLSVSVFRLMKIRVIWLSLLAVAGTLTVKVLSNFESTLNEVVTLALFIPLLIGIGGNTGAQSATTIVRALAVDDIRVDDFMRVALRETAVGIQLGLFLGLAGYVIVSVIFQHNIALIVSLSLLSICSMAAFTGSLMPILARVMNLDPAVVSGPFVSTLIDASGLLIYFSIAKIVMSSI